MIFLKQSDPQWHNVVVGDGKAPEHTLGWIGCEVTAAGIAANTLLGTTYTPPEINEIARKNGCYAPNKAGYRVLLNLELLAPHIGLVMRDRERIRLPVGSDPMGEEARALKLRLLAGQVLAAGGVVIAHVDLNHTLPNGDPYGDHFIAGLTRDAGADLNVASILRGSDPAPGNAVEIDEATMTGVSMWGAQRKAYTVVSIAPVYRAA